MPFRFSSQAVHFETSEIDPYSSKKRPPNKHHSSNRRAQRARLVSLWPNSANIGYFKRIVVTRPGILHRVGVLLLFRRSGYVF